MSFIIKPAAGGRELVGDDEVHAVLEDAARRAAADEPFVAPGDLVTVTLTLTIS